jgi:DNA-binding LacI/PurR family transcriptional regulator
LKVSIKNVALKAGVSTATVSRVISGSCNVKEKTRFKVIRVIEELNYEPNAVARSLRQKKTYSIGISIGNVLSEFYSIIAKSVEDVANEFGYNMILCNSDFNSKKELDYLKVLKSNRVDGIILCPTGENADYINTLIDSGIGIILLDGIVEGVKCDTVLSDNEGGSYMAISHLIKQGYSSIGVINGNLKRTTGKDRLKGCLRALKEAKIKVDKELIKIGDFRKTSGSELTEEFLASKKRPDAIFVGNLDMTMGALVKIKEMGLNIPEDIGIIGFDDSDWAKIFNPPITTVSQPVYEMGKTAAMMLINKINGNSDYENNSASARIVVFETKLMERDSTKKIIR